METYTVQSMKIEANQFFVLFEDQIALEEYVDEDVAQKRATDLNRSASFIKSDNK